MKLVLKCVMLFVRCKRCNWSAPLVQGLIRHRCLRHRRHLPQRGRHWRKGEALPNKLRQSLPRDGEGVSGHKPLTDEVADIAEMLFYGGFAKLTALPLWGRCRACAAERATNERCALSVTMPALKGQSWCHLSRRERLPGLC